MDGFVDGLAWRIAALTPGVAAAAKAAVDAAADPQPAGLAEENALWGQLFAQPVTAALIRAAGAQTRAGERDLEGLMSQL